MILYLAGVYATNLHLTGAAAQRWLPHELAHRKRVQYFLESYHYVKSNSYVTKMRLDKIKVFLDSGAFSAFTLGKETDIDAYCQYIRDNADIIDVASVLDGIGDPQKTYENQCYMEAQGTRPLPCFHYGEDERYLEYYLERYPYITLGGMVPISKPQLKLWLDRIWHDYLCDDKGAPKVKVHGFGLTAIDLIERYPWYSVDSSTWAHRSFLGSILIPQVGIIQVSDTSPALKVPNQHLETLAPLMRAKVLHEIERRGFSYERVNKEYMARFAFNMAAFREINERINQRSNHFVVEQMRIF